MGEIGEAHVKEKRRNDTRREEQSIKQARQAKLFVACVPMAFAPAPCHTPDFLTCSARGRVTVKVGDFLDFADPARHAALKALEKLNVRDQVPKIGRCGWASRSFRLREDDV